MSLSAAASSWAPAVQPATEGAVWTQEDEDNYDMVYGEGATQWTEDDDANVDAYLQQEGAAFEDEELNGKHKYGDLEYWEGRYNENDGKLKDPFDWLFTYADVAPLLEAFVDKSDHILMQGCGNAPFSKDMYNAGYNRQTNIDYSEVVIEQMQKLHADVQQYLNFQVGDSRSLMYPKNTFDVVIDKGVYDTLVCYKDKVKAVFDMVYESGRVLKPGGLYILFSLHDADDLLIFLEKQPSLHWVVGVVRLENRERMHSIIVCRKLSEEKYVPPCYCTAYTDLETDRYMRKLRNSAKHLHQQGMSVQQFQTGVKPASALARASDSELIAKLDRALVGNMDRRRKSLIKV